MPRDGLVHAVVEHLGGETVYRQLGVPKYMPGRG